MRKFSLVVATLIFAVMFAVSANAQTGAAAQAGFAKIGLIDSGAFGMEKEGISRYVNAVKQLGTEMKPLENELVTMQSKMQTLADQIASLQKVPANAQDPKSILDKQDEGQRLQREFEFKKKEYDARVEKRGNELLGPIQGDIGKAIQEYALARGYTMILDIDKLGRDGALLALDPKAEITKEFITFFNTRAPSTASAAKPN
ncbi:MAG: OmpH family outer membrane protein [Acidobacteriota bacterium]